MMLSCSFQKIYIPEGGCDIFFVSFHLLAAFDLTENQFLVGGSALNIIREINSTRFNYLAPSANCQPQLLLSQWKKEKKRQRIKNLLTMKRQQFHRLGITLNYKP